MAMVSPIINVSFKLLIPLMENERLINRLFTKAVFLWSKINIGM